MKTNKIKLGTLLLAGAFFAFTACKKNEEATTAGTTSTSATTAVTPSGKQLEPATARTSLNTTSSKLSAEVTSVSNTPSTTGITALFKELGNDDSSTSPSPRLANGIAAFAKKQKEFEAEPLKEAYGLTITLNEVTHKPDSVKRTGTSNDVVIILPKGDDNPKVELTISSFKMVEVTTTDSVGNPIKEGMPIELIASVKLDDSATPNASVNLKATYASDGTPTFIDADLTVDTYVISLDLLGTDTKNKAEVVLKNGSSVIIGAGVDIDYKAGSEKEDDDITKAAGYVQIQDIQVIGYADVAALKAIPEETGTIDDVNKNISLVIVEVSTGDELAKVQLKERTDIDNNKETYAALVYKDSSEDDAETVFKSVIDEVEKEINEFTGSNP